jgi:integrase
MAEKEHLLGLGMAWAEPEAMFTTVQGYYLDPDNTSKLFKALCRKAKIGDWHLHELRHTAATLLLSRGIPLEQVSKILGHASIRITSDVYGHLTTEHLRAATETMGALLEGLEKPSVSRSVSPKDYP